MNDVFLLMSPRRQPHSSPSKSPPGRPERGHIYLLMFLLIALGSLVVGAALIEPDRWVTLGATALLFGAGTLVSGGLIGLLFGVPRVIGAVIDTAPDAPAEVSRRTGYAANTNLERVSDWLTAIIVGVTLTQLGEIPGMFQRLVDYMTGPFGGAVSPTMVAATIVLFLTGGFLFGFLWSRLTLGPAFLAADRDSVETLVADEVERQLTVRDIR